MNLYKLATILVTAVFVAMGGNVFAANPAYSVPEKVEYQMKACQDLDEIAKKYGIERIFPKEFEEGRQCLSRVELAAALEVTTERLADKVIKDGAASVAKSDLDKLADIREELRAEMLLVNTRTFQQRHELLGTLLHPLTRTISLSGQMVGVFQSTAGYRKNQATGAKESDHSAFNGRGDLVFNFRVGENTTAVINVDALLGDGLDGKINSFAGLNGVADNTDASARFRQAWVEHSMFDEKLVGTIGLIDLANYFDNNALANDENSQFLSSAFVNAHILAVPQRGPGARLTATLEEAVQVGVAYASGDASGNEFLRNGFFIVELDVKRRFGGLEGNYRFYGAIDGALPDGTAKTSQRNAYNAGISLDQQLTDKLSIFGRFGQRERNAYLTSRSWSAGLQYCGLIPGRSDDMIGLAYGQISGKGMESQEKLVEGFYRAKVNEKISIAPIAQYLIDPLGDKKADDVVTLGIRTQVSF